ncbi:MAG TPA: cysteine dioxygenase [Streptosporangiaceae bacterium]|nr:cysteine dioxygenase [Streptosporangiaceae bacterium]
MKIDIIPDITMRGQADPHGRAAGSRRPTVGRLAAGLRDLAAGRADWRAAVRLDPAGPRRIRLDAELAGAADLWLTTWPPRHAAGLHAEPAEISTLVAGELVEVAIGPDGVTERPLRAGRVQIRGTLPSLGTRALRNPGAGYAVTLHARPR